MRLAAVDIGTNTVRLLIADVVQDQLKTVVRRAIITCLGEDVAKARRFKPEAIERTLAVLEQFTQELKDKGTESVHVVATSAARDAQNGQQFIEQVKERFGWEADILSGQEEGMLAFLGATSDFPLPKPYSRPVLIDVGGGSTELACGQGMSLQKLHSLDIGSVRLTEMFIKNDPPTQDEVESVKAYVREKTSELLTEICEEDSDLIAIGVAGTITTLSAIKQKLTVYDSNKVHLSTLTVSDIETILNQLMGAPLKERKKIPGLEPKRADVIIAGTIITLEILSGLGLTELTVSEHDLLDGLIWTAAPGVRARTI